jgi:hypothetical protein
MRGQVVPRPAGRHGDIRFWFGLIIEGEGKLRLHDPALSERCSERLGDKADAGGVRRALGFTDKKYAGYQLKTLAGIERTLLDQVVILGPCPASGAWICHLHGV